MNKNGTYFVSVVADSQFTSALWDPFAYKSRGDGGVLSDYVSVSKIESKRIPHGFTRFRPIEYRDLPGGDYLSFSLDREDTLSRKIAPAVIEGTILFGTMRAYLGNIAVTPMAEWIGAEGPVFFETKSEFAAVKPDDGLTYFWLVYLRSRHFLQHLPLGSGGTRPRLDPTALDAVPVSAPDLQTRQDIHNRIKELARCEWETHFEATDAINTISRSF